MSRGLNYAASVSPAFNLMKAIGEGGGLASGLQMSGPAPGSAGPLSNAFVQQASPAMQFRQPTQVYERSIWGNQMRPATQQEQSDYRQGWLSDQRNVGGGQGQADRGLAQAAMQQESGGSEGGK